MLPLIAQAFGAHIAISSQNIPTVYSAHTIQCRVVWFYNFMFFIAFFVINQITCFSKEEMLIYFLYQFPLILTALLHVDLINVGYLTARVFIRS